MTTEGLAVQELSVRFGGAVAVNGVSLHAPLGAVTGLIGPNGAGKTTTFNACSGLVRPTRGSISLGGLDVTHRSAPARARLGLGRTFQRMELYGSMTAYENVALGAESARIGGNPLRQLIGSRRDRFRVAADTEAAIELCGLGPVRDHRVDGLSTGWRRLTELARACAGGYRLLLLDEPSSGLDHRETESVSRILRSLVEVKHLGILLVEHDMALVMSVCANIFVLDFGVLIFTGTPQQVQADPTVRSAYLGSEEGLEEAQAREEAAEQGRCRQLDDATAGRS